jgi:hypothetical protein
MFKKGRKIKIDQVWTVGSGGSRRLVEGYPNSKICKICRVVRVTTFHARALQQLNICHGFC